ncbi:hypothetical protein V8F33_012107 [Rhypophila sp. PSN 637]
MEVATTPLPRRRRVRLATPTTPTSLPSISSDSEMEDSPNELDRILFDPDGDLTLLVGGNWVGPIRGPGDEDAPGEYLVCSRTLSRASMVFNKMLNGPFLEGRPKDGSGSKWVVRLPEDNPSASTVVLAIIHSQFDLLPYNMTPRELYYVLIFTDKYDMTRILQPWAARWMPSSRSFRESIDVLPLIAISWQLGARYELNWIARRMVAGCCADKNGDLVRPIGLPPDPSCIPLFPDGFMSQMARKRKEILAKSFAFIRVTLNRVTQSIRRIPYESRSCSPKRTQREVERRPIACEAIALSCIFSWLSETELSAIWPPYGQEVTSCYPLSVNDLISRLHSVQFDVAEAAGHSSCLSPNLAEDLVQYIRGLLREEENLLTAVQDEFLEKQSDKVGVIQALPLEERVMDEDEDMIPITRSWGRR